MRVTNINEIDLNLYPFDFDLTMAILLANADGTTYHRYGGRSNISPMSMEGLIDLMQEGLKTHRYHKMDGSMPEKKPPFVLPEVVTHRLGDMMQPVSGCYHCHYAREAKQLLTLDQGDWTPDKFWIFPQPERLGLVMNQKHQYNVEKVIADSPAAAAGIKKGNRIQKISSTRVLTKCDIQWQLDKLSGGAIHLPFTLEHDGEEFEGKLDLAAGWKVGEPEEHSWRVSNPFTAHMIKFLPAPGLVGDRLTAGELKSAGLSKETFGLRVTKLNYGPHQAGIRLGDIVLGAAGRSDFRTTRDFYSWCEELRRAGRDIKIQLRREGNEMAMMVSLSYLNYSRMERAPSVDIGFTPQQLPGDGGVRVGLVKEDSSAENAGLITGDLVGQVDGEPVSTTERFNSLVNKKAPGDLVTLDLTRQGVPLKIGYFLPGEGQILSEVASLADAVTQKGQQTECIVSINLPPGRHIYSAHRRSQGLPTKVEFRGKGYRLIGNLAEPEPKQSGGDWILEGQVELKQQIEITDPDQFQLLLRIYAQVCDENSCHEFSAILQSEGTKQFFESTREFELEPKIAPDAK